MIRGFLPYGGGGGGTPDPIFRTQKEHDDYWTKVLIEKAKKERPDLFAAYSGLNGYDKSALYEGDQGTMYTYGKEFHPGYKTNDLQGDLNTLLVKMGGIPKWSPPTQQQPQQQQPQAPSRILDIGHGMPNVGGYRYNAGQGKPALRSITNRRRRRLR